MSDIEVHDFQQIPGRDRCAECYMPRTHGIHIIARLRSEPDHPWHISRNTDGGAAAEDFILHAQERNAAPQAEKDAARRARCLAVLAELGR